METELESMLVRLVGDGSDYSKMLSQATSSTQQFGKDVKGELSGIQSFAANVGSALAALGLGNVLREAFGNFAEAESIGIRLGATLQANGRDVAALTARYGDFATRMESTTTLEDDFVLSLLNTAESMGATGAAAERAVSDAAALASATGGAADAMLRVSSALAQGDTARAMMFSRSIMQLRGVKDEAEFIAKYTALVAAGMDASARETETASGQLRMLSRDWGNALEDVGKLVSEGLLPMVKWLREGVVWFRSLSDETKQNITVVLALTSAFLALGPALAVIGLIASTIFTPWTIGIGLVMAGVAAWIDHVGGIRPAMEAVADYVKEGMLRAEFYFTRFGDYVLLTWNRVRFGAQAVFEFIRNGFGGGMSDELKALEAQIAEQQRSLSMDWTQFRNARRSQDNSRRAGEEDIRPYIRAVTSELRNLDFVLFGSGEAAARIQQYRDLLSVGPNRGGAQGPSSPVAANLGGIPPANRIPDNMTIRELEQWLAARVPIPSPRVEAASNRGELSLAVLNAIEDNLIQIAANTARANNLELEIVESFE